ncbi:hypothetical protein NGI46_26910 [Peribacillus butanolivorans]|uniref:DUF6680 family protein n=1 Tax=Peribacillus butanolivorans TaxID=421767 RepID=UPI00207CAB83|nr:DUF6680 family protein [Peribacillus butanolivorans]MCO0600950.1 hypothetical protein [Peribacillus butanolivorans]
MGIPGWLYVILIFFSGLVGVIITLITQNVRQTKRDKYELLICFVENRFNVKSTEFTRALNKVYIVFGKNKEVITALRRFHDGITYENPGEDEINRRLLALYKAMCQDLKIDPMDDTLFQVPFNTSI